MGLWNCQSSVNKAVFIPAFASHSTLTMLGLTETWIRPEATPASLYSITTSLSLTPLASRGGGTALLISNNWKFSTLPSLCNNNSFEYHALTLTTPIKIHSVVIYRPPRSPGKLCRGAGWAAVLFPWGWHPTCSLCRLQHSF